MNDSVLHRVRTLLLGSAFTSVRYEDVWVLGTDRDRHLLAQHIAGSTAGEIARALGRNPTHLPASVDPGIVPCAAAVFLALRKPIAEVDLRADAALLLRFADGVALDVHVDVDVVDWQWSVSRTPVSPYLDFEVACFQRGEVAERPIVAP